MKKITLPGTGLVASPQVAANKPVLFAYGVSPFDWSKILPDDGDPTPMQFNIPDKDQGGAGTCTVQSEAYGFYHITGIETSIEDPYSHVFLPGGGAYLDSPENWVNTQGYLPSISFPDPDPQLEDNMEKIIVVKDGDRIKKFSIKTSIISPITIDAAAEACQNHSYLKLGIFGSWSQGWNGSWTEPSFKGVTNWQHAIMACKDSVVIRNGKKAIKCKSSWTAHKDYLGKQNYCHFINEDYFNAGGVFELLAVDIKELPMNETIYTINFNGKAGLRFQGQYTANEIYANNEAHYQELGDSFGKKTCSPDPANPGKWIFASFDLTINTPK